MAIGDVLSDVGGWLKGIVEFGLGLVLVLLVVQVIFPGAGNIVGNVTDFVGMFTDGGINGLIAALLFIAIYRS